MKSHPLTKRRRSSLPASTQWRASFGGVSEVVFLKELESCSKGLERKGIMLDVAHF